MEGFIVRQYFFDVLGTIEKRFPSILDGQKTEDAENYPAMPKAWRDSFFDVCRPDGKT